MSRGLGRIQRTVINVLPPEETRLERLTRIVYATKTPTRAQRTAVARACRGLADRGYVDLVRSGRETAVCLRKDPRPATAPRGPRHSNDADDAAGVIDLLPDDLVALSGLHIAVNVLRSMPAPEDLKLPTGERALRDAVESVQFHAGWSRRMKARLGEARKQSRIRESGTLG
jgi:hypothetical protein